MSSAPIVVAQITDPHLRYDEPARTHQLAATVDALLAMELPLAAVLITGDIADDGRADEYALAATELARLNAPLVVLAGNHDDRAALRAAFDLPGALADPIRGTLELPGLRLIAGDTTVPGEDPGIVDTDWIATQLSADRSTPTIIALHHVPIALGSPGIDELGVPATDRAALAALLADAPNVLAVIAGHVHRATLGRLGGVPVITAPSSNVQLAFDLTGELEVTNDEPPALMLHAVTGDGLVSHVQPVPRA